MILQFTKMHGLGNDFVIIDSRKDEAKLTFPQIIKICDHKFGIGCDQLITIKNSQEADCEMEIFNQDGSKAGACGNAARCVSKLIGLTDGKIKVGERLLKVTSKNNVFSVDMGPVTIVPSEIPALCSDPMNIVFENEPILNKGYAAGIGNPHLVFFLGSFTGLDIPLEGRKFEHHEYFPQRANISFAKIIDQNTIEMKVWERGVGITQACGSAACVVAFIANKLGKVGKEVNIKLPGGDLLITLGNKSVTMSGPAEISFIGEISID